MSVACVRACDADEKLGQWKQTIVQNMWAVAREVPTAVHVI